MYLPEIESSENVSTTAPLFSIREALEVVIAWCEKNPDKRLLKISWLFTLRCKHLATALKVIIGLLPAE